jgi:16S rRNA (cytosine1402-N4)-methyltransferase
MAKEVIDYLRPKPGGRYVDLTLGAGGHTRQILQHSSPTGEVLAIDQDPEAIKIARTNLDSFGMRVHFVHGNFAQLGNLLKSHGWERVDGILADLGVSSMQFDIAGRGFSFSKAGPLDMRMDPTSGKDLAEYLEHIEPNQLAYVLKSLGEVSHAKKIANRIIHEYRQGSLTDTKKLAQVAFERMGHKKINPATKVFMALRMMVNQELENLEAFLNYLPEPLKIGGRVVVISFHSKEDRLVKRRFKMLEGECKCPPGLPQCGCNQKRYMQLITRRAMKPSVTEIDSNPRARSARLRAAERVAA